MKKSQAIIPIPRSWCEGDLLCLFLVSMAFSYVFALIRRS